MNERVYVKRMSECLIWAIVFIMVTMISPRAAFASSDAAFQAAPPENSANIRIDGDYLTFTDAIPENRSGRIMIPYRAVLESLGASVGYDEDTGVISGKRNDSYFELRAGDENIDFTDSEGKKSVIKMDVIPYIKNGRTFVPVRFVSNVLGYSVGWDNERRTVIIIDTDRILSKAEDDFSLIFRADDIMPDRERTYRIDETFNMCSHGEKGNPDIDIVMNNTGKINGSRMAGDCHIEGKRDRLNVAVNGKIRMDAEKNILEMKLGNDSAWKNMLSGNNYQNSGNINETAYKAMLFGGIDLHDFIRDIVLIPEDKYDVYSYEKMKAMYKAAVGILGDDAFSKEDSMYSREFVLGDLLGEAENTANPLNQDGKIVVQLYEENGRIYGMDMAFKAYSDSEGQIMDTDILVKSTEDSHFIEISVACPYMNSKVTNDMKIEPSYSEFDWQADF